MKVSQILNNNVADIKRGSQEVIVYSKGISFKKCSRDSHDQLDHFSYFK